MFLRCLEAARLVKRKLKAFNKIDLTTSKLNFRLFRFEVKSLFNYEMELKKFCFKIYKVEGEVKRIGSNIPALCHNLYSGHPSMFRKLNNEQSSVNQLLRTVCIMFSFR